MRAMKAFRACSVLAAIALLPIPSSDSSAEPAYTRALIVVRTLVIDGMGTRTVDTDTARVPFGSRGLLIRQVPYAGPPLSFRLSILAGPPQEAGIPVTVAAEIWNGGVDNAPAPGVVARREEATVVSPDSSYLFEIDHDETNERRVVLSISARPITEEQSMMPPMPLSSARPVHFLIAVIRQVGDTVDPVDSHILTTLVGQAVTYSSGITVRSAPGAGGTGSETTSKTVGLTVTLTADQVLDSLITVKVRLSGADYVDAGRTMLEPIEMTTMTTVTSGSLFEITAKVPAAPGDSLPAEPPPGVEIRPVTYTVQVTPRLD